MDLQLLTAQWTGRLPNGFVRPAILDRGLATCCHRRCRKVAIKKNGEPATACARCLACGTTTPTGMHGSCTQTSRAVTNRSVFTPMSWTSR